MRITVMSGRLATLSLVAAKAHDDVRTETSSEDLANEIGI